CDNLYSVSNTDASQTLLINKLTPTIATTTAPASPVVTGTGVQDQAVLTGATPTAGGTVTYKLYSVLVCPGSPVDTSNAAAATNGGEGPAIFWRLGEASGTTATDTSGGAHDGTFSSAGGVLGAAGALVNDTSTAVTLDGVAGAIQEASGAGVPVGATARSVEIWFKTTTATAQPLFNYGTAGLRSQFSVYLAGNQVQVNDGTE